MRRDLTAVFAASIAAALLLCSPLPVAADGPVVLTIVGEVGKTNRGPVDPFTDKFMVFQGAQFDRAIEFDLASLWALGPRKIRVSYPGWPAAHDFEGPLLKDVLAAAGVFGGSAEPVALDGYAAQIPYSDLEKWPVILALKMDGRWLPLGGVGPSWVIYPRDDFPELRTSDDAKWVWGVTHIRVSRPDPELRR